VGNSRDHTWGILAILDSVARSFFWAGPRVLHASSGEQDNKAAIASATSGNGSPEMEDAARAAMAEP
jgi:hypothetical protein